MADPNWDRGVDIDVPAKPTHGNWTQAVDYVDAAKRLKFVVDDERPDPAAAVQPARIPNKWNYAQDRACAADGDPKAPINPANCLIPDAPPGALIAKIGGSTAGKTGDGVKSFVVGSFCVIDIDDKTKGTVYLTMNADPMGLLDRTGELRVKVYRSG